MFAMDDWKVGMMNGGNAGHRSYRLSESLGPFGIFAELSFVEYGWIGIKEGCVVDLKLDHAVRILGSRRHVR